MTNKEIDRESAKSIDMVQVTHPNQIWSSEDPAKKKATQTDVSAQLKPRTKEEKRTLPVCPVSSFQFSTVMHVLRRPNLISLSPVSTYFNAPPPIAHCY